MITDLNQLLAQEAKLQFQSFDHQTAWELGCLLKENAEQRSVTVAIEIVKNRHCLFSFALCPIRPQTIKLGLSENAMWLSASSIALGIWGNITKRKERR